MELELLFIVLVQKTFIVVAVILCGQKFSNTMLFRGFLFRISTRRLMNSENNRTPAISFISFEKSKIGYKFWLKFLQISTYNDTDNIK